MLRAGKAVLRRRRRSDAARRAAVRRVRRLEAGMPEPHINRRAPSTPQSSRTVSCRAADLKAPPAVPAPNERQHRRITSAAISASHRRRKISPRERRARKKHASPSSVIANDDNVRLTSEAKAHECRRAIARETPNRTCVSGLAGQQRKDDSEAE